MISDGIRVIKSNGLICFEKKEGNVIESRIIPANNQIKLTQLLDGVRSKIDVDLSTDDEVCIWSVIPGSESECQTMYRTLQKSLSNRNHPNILQRVIKNVLFGFAALILVIAFWPMSDEKPFQKGLDPVVSSSKSSIQAPPQLSLSEFKEVVATQGIPLKSSGKPFYVFSDPNCPFCKTLEKSLSTLDASFNPVILPVGFKPGSREVASAIVCSTNPVAAWRSYLVDGVSPIASPCEKGDLQVSANMALFEKLALNVTPTMVSPSGLIVVGSGDSEKIAAVMSMAAK